MRAAVVATALLGSVTLAGCFRTPIHRCDEATDCAGGACFIEPGADHGLCAVTDEACGGGLRYADDAGDVAGECIQGVNPPDAGPGDDAGFVAYDACLLGGPVPAQDTCTIAVCDAMPRCCTHEWSELCRMEAERRCTSRCGEVAAYAGGDNAVPGSGFLGVGRWNGDTFAAIWSADVTTEIVGSVAWGDVDGDLRPELAACGDDPDGGNVVHIYRATGGDPAFTEDSGESPISLKGHCFDLEWIDLDADGDLDLLYGTFLGPEWIRNDGGGIWASPDDDYFPASAMGVLSAIDFADLDADGRFEIAIGPYDEPLRVFDNTTSGMVSYAPVPDLATGHWESVTWGDVDDDGVLDILASGDTALQVIRNTSTDGGFTPGASLFTPAEPRDAQASALIDADEDGDLDALVHAADVAVRLFRNNGSGTPLFTETPLWDSDPDGGIDPLFTDPAFVALTLGDVDGDTHLDFVACGTPGPCEMWTGDGTGDFTGEWAPGGTTPYRAIALTGVWPGILAAPP